MKKQIVLIIGLLFISFFSKAQSVELNLISTIAGSYNADELSMNFSLGELAIESFQTNDLFLTQGFLQPIKAVQTSIKEISETIGFNIYPNPAVDYFNIELKLDRWLEFDGDIVMELIDMNGKVVQISSIDKPQVKVSIEGLSSGIYHVVISSKRFSFREVHMLQKVKI